MFILTQHSNKTVFCFQVTLQAVNEAVKALEDIQERMRQMEEAVVRYQSISYGFVCTHKSCIGYVKYILHTVC